MNSHNPRLERLKELLSLEERRVSVQQELETISLRMSSLRDSLFDEGTAVAQSSSTGTTRSPASKAPQKRGPQKRGTRGLLKSQILAALSSAGSAGVKVKELAQALGIKPVNIHSWFHSSIKRYPMIKKLQGGHYRLEGKLENEETGASSQDQASTSPRSGATKPTKRRGRGPARHKAGTKESSSPNTRRGALSNKVLAELEKAGSKGASVRDIASNIGANYRNIYIWFATTGKKNPKVKKVAPAQYRLLS